MYHTPFSYQLHIICPETKWGPIMILGRYYVLFSIWVYTLAASQKDGLGRGKLFWKLKVCIDILTSLVCSLARKNLLSFFPHQFEFLWDLEWLHQVICLCGSGYVYVCPFMMYGVMCGNNCVAWFYKTYLPKWLSHDLTLAFIYCPCEMWTECKPNLHIVVFFDIKQIRSKS